MRVWVHVCGRDLGLVEGGARCPAVLGGHQYTSMSSGDANGGIVGSVTLAATPATPSGPARGTHTHTYIHIHIRIYAYTYTYNIHAHIHAHIHTYIYTRIYAQ